MPVQNDTIIQYCIDTFICGILERKLTDIEIKLISLKPSLTTRTTPSSSKAKKFFTKLINQDEYLV